VNGHRVDIPSYCVKPGDVISVAEAGRSQQLGTRAADQTQIRPVMDWLSFDREKLTGTVNRLPEAEEIDTMVNVQPRRRALFPVIRGLPHGPANVTFGALEPTERHIFVIGGQAIDSRDPLHR
jgi:hypothetical protein